MSKQHIIRSLFSSFYSFCFKLILISILLMNLYSKLLSNDETSQIKQEMYHRDYTFLFGFNYDISNSSENFRTLLKMYTDVYYRKIEPKLENSTRKEILGFTWTFFGKWMSFLLPHEFGHALRTTQAGGNFGFVRFASFGVIGSLKLPETASLEDHTLSLIGGFEANHLTAKNVQLDFYKYDGLYNDEYGMAFAHKIMYPLYAFVFSPQNPKDPNTWVKAGGDPVNFTKLVWERGNREVLIKKNSFVSPILNQFYYDDTVVNPKLVQFYNNTAIASVLWNLLDFNFYRQAHSFFGEQMEGKRPIFLGNDFFKWSYGTFFNTSVIGAELYLYNYFKVNQSFFSIYLKSGFPYKNNGIGWIFYDLIQFKLLSIDLQIDLWKQEFYGNGFAFLPSFRYKFNTEFTLIAQIGYKTKGYLIGKTIESDGIGFIGVKYNFLN